MTYDAAKSRARLMARATGECYYVLGPCPQDGFWAARARDRVEIWPDRTPLFTAAPDGREEESVPCPLWIAEERPYFLARRDDGDELWLSRRPVAANERIAKFPAGHEVTLFDIRAAIESPR